MQVTHHVEELQRQLLAAASAGTAETEEIAGRLVTALDAAARLAILEALADAVGEITRELAPGSVDLRLRGREVEFVVAAAPEAGAPTTAKESPMNASAASAAGSAPQADELDDGSTSRTTLRLPEALKVRAEAAAALEGVSLNTWLVRAVSSALEPKPAARESRGSSYTGWLR